MMEAAIALLVSTAAGAIVTWYGANRAAAPPATPKLPETNRARTQSAVDSWQR